MSRNKPKFDSNQLENMFNLAEIAPQNISDTMVADIMKPDSLMLNSSMVAEILSSNNKE